MVTSHHCGECGNEVSEACPDHPNHEIVTIQTARSWKPEFLIGDQWASNAQRFATSIQALESARARFQVWTAPRDYRATASDDPVNYVRRAGVDAPIGGDS